MDPIDLLGLASVIHPAPDLPASRTFFTGLLGVEPYFDEPFYVGYRIAGFELGLDPDGDPAAGAAVYWRVADADAAADRLAAAGAAIVEPVHDVGGGIRMALAELPGGTGRLGVIQQPAD